MIKYVLCKDYVKNVWNSVFQDTAGHFKNQTQMKECGTHLKFFHPFVVCAVHR